MDLNSNSKGHSISDKIVVPIDPWYLERSNKDFTLDSFNIMSVEGGVLGGVEEGYAPRIDEGVGGLGSGVEYGEGGGEVKGEDGQVGMAASDVGPRGIESEGATEVVVSSEISL